MIEGYSEGGVVLEYRRVVMEIAVGIPLEPVNRLLTIDETTDFRHIIILGNEILQILRVLAIIGPTALNLVGNELPLLPD